MDAGLGRGGIEAGLGRGGMPAWLGRGIADGFGRAAPPETPNGLLPGLRAGGRGAPPAGPGRGAPGAPGAAGRPAAGEPGRGGTEPGPGGRGREPPSAGGCCARRSASRVRAAWAALTAASCSALSAEARASAAATSMSWALAGLATGPGVGPGRLGAGGLGRTNGPGIGAGDVGALGAPAAGAAGRRGGCGRAVGGAGRAELGAGALGADGADAAGADPASRAPRSRRATGASTVLDADLTNSPISLSLARTVLLSTPSSFASSCTRALPGTALLTSRSCEQHPQRPHSCTRSLFISGTSSCAHLGRPTLLGRDAATGATSSVVPNGMATVRMCSASKPVSATPVSRSARPKARRRSASAKQAGSGCRCAPRPGSRRPGSGWSRRSSPEPAVTNRINSEAGARSRQPTQVRVGPTMRKSTPRERRTRMPVSFQPRRHPDRRRRPAHCPDGCRCASR